ncbi:ribosomal silencing factor RsfS [Bacteroidia bacterium]|nr:ribosomal silencing factor RsfS [Bacteroidia bacterium]
MDQQVEQRTQQVCSILHDKKAQDIVCLDIAHMTVMAEAFVLCSGRSSVQVKALFDELEETLLAEQVAPVRKEGYSEGRWAVLDYGDFMVHIFQEEEREFYNLERLWVDGNNVTHFPPRV